MSGSPDWTRRGSGAGGGGAIFGSTRVVGVIGHPVEHSLSPPMQNAAIRALGLDWVYVAFPVPPEAIPAAIAGARALGIVGLNCTIPHKELVPPHLDEIDPIARAIGAVNTIHFRPDGRAVGHNTDAYGFAATVMAEAEIPLEGATVLVLGGGGAARGMAAGAAIEKARKVILANRSRERAERIVADLEPVFPDTRWEVVQASEPSLRNAAERSTVIANATSLGMRAEDPSPIPASCILPEHVVFESVYAQPETALLRAAREAGAIRVGGLGMLARQGAKSLSIWSGMEPSEDLMLDTLRAVLRERALAAASGKKSNA